MVLATLDALGQIGDPGATEPVWELVSSADLAYRIGAIEALGEIGDSSAVNPLVSEFTHDEPSVRWASSVALGRIGRREALAPMMKSLSVERESIRSVYLKSLDRIDPDWRLGKPAGELIERCVSELKDESLTSAHRRRAVGLIRELGPDCFKSSAGAELVEELVARLSNAEPLLREASAEALAEIGDSSAARPIIRTFSAEPVWEVREDLATALGVTGRVEAMSPLI